MGATNLVLLCVQISWGYKKIYSHDKGVGARNLEPGERKRKLVRGNLITEEIYQLNCQLIDSTLPEKETT